MDENDDREELTEMMCERESRPRWTPGREALGEEPQECVAIVALSDACGIAAAWPSMGLPLAACARETATRGRYSALWTQGLLPEERLPEALRRSAS